jgi:hypothetical protein
MLIINNKKIKSKRSLTIFLLENEIESVENISELNKMYNIDFNDENLKSILYFFKEYGNITLKYIKKVDDNDFNVDRFIYYVNFIKENPKCNNIIKIWSVIYGEDKAKEKLSKIRKKTITPFSTEYWINKGLTEEEAMIKTKEYRVKCGSNLENFIKRYGEEIGLVKYNEFREKSKHTLETFMIKYGEDIGREKYNEYLKTKDSNSFDWALKKANGNTELAKQIITERKKSTITNLETMIIKYGDVELAKQKLIELNKKRDNSSMDYFLKKANGDKVKAKELYFTHSIKKDCMSINYFLRKSNGDLELAKILQDREIKKRGVSFFTASKESLKIFIPLYKYLRKNGIFRDDIYLGVKGSNEFKLHDLIKNRTYSYDFTITYLKTIIEYHGERFHPNIEKYGFEYLKENWGKEFNINLEEKINFDLNKKQTAIDNGYDYIEIWSSDDENTINEKLLKLKNKTYEN